MPTSADLGVPFDAASRVLPFPAPSTKQELADEFNRELAHAPKEKYPIVGEPAPRVLFLWNRSWARDKKLGLGKITQIFCYGCMEE